MKSHTICSIISLVTGLSESFVKPDGSNFPITFCCKSFLIRFVNGSKASNRYLRFTACIKKSNACNALNTPNLPRTKLFILVSRWLRQILSKQHATSVFGPSKNTIAAGFASASLLTSKTFCSCANTFFAFLRFGARFLRGIWTFCKSPLNRGFLPNDTQNFCCRKTTMRKRPPHGSLENRGQRALPEEVAVAGVAWAGESSACQIVRKLNP